jgi:hypothetical protein
VVWDLEIVRGEEGMVGLQGVVTFCTLLFMVAGADGVPQMRWSGCVQRCCMSNALWFMTMPVRHGVLRKARGWMRCQVRIVLAELCASLYSHSVLVGA